MLRFLIFENRDCINILATL